jgi:hypothetical protein
MELNEFADDFPELYAMIEQDVKNYIAENNMNGEESLNAWENMIENFVNNYEQNNYFGYNVEEVISQQIPYYDYRDWDRDNRFRRRRRRRFRDFNIRDILRLLFLRQLFDRRHRFYY